MTHMDVIKLLIGSSFVILIPGLAWTYVIFKKDSIDWVERITIAVALSIALNSIVVYWLNRTVDLELTFTNVVAIVVLITFSACIARIISRYRKPFKDMLFFKAKQLKKYVGAKLG